MAAMPIMRLKLAIDKLFTKHLFATNVLTCSTLLGVGDACVQGMNIAYHRHRKNPEPVYYDFPRTGRMIIIGLGLGPFNHFWYSLLDKFVKGTGGIVTLKKIALDQACAGPFFCTLFLTGTSLLEGKGVEGAKKEMKEKFLPIYMVDWCFWPMAQFVNFKYVPNKYRVAYVSLATLIWNTFLSFIKHRSPPPQTKQLEQDD